MEPHILNCIILSLYAWLCIFTPTVAWCGLNTIFFTGTQILNSFIVSASLGLAYAICTGIIYILVNIYAKAPYLDQILIFISIGVSSLILSLLNEGLLKEYAHSLKQKYLIIIIFLIFMILLSWISLFIPLSILIIYLFSSLFDFIHNYKHPKTLLLQDLKEYKIDYDEKYSFKIKPNVYLFYLESTSSSVALNAIYNSNFGEILEQFCTRLGLTCYPEAFSNTDYTFNARENLFSMQNLDIWTSHYRTLSYYPKVLSIFKQNGYFISIYDPSKYVFGQYADMVDFCYFKNKIPLHFFKRLQKFTPLFAQSSLYRAFSGGLDPGELPPSAGYEACRDTLFKSIKEGNSPTPRFNIIYFGTDHAKYYRNPPPHTPETFPIEYIDTYQWSGKFLIEYLEFIRKHDPDSVIIAVGDHGGHSFDYKWINSENPETAISESGLDRKLLFLDLFSVFLAIRWPNDTAPANFCPSTSRIFSYLFAELCSNPSLVPDTSCEVSLLSHKFKYFYVQAINRKPLSYIIPSKNFDSSNLPSLLSEAPRSITSDNNL